MKSLLVLMLALAFVVCTTPAFAGTDSGPPAAAVAILELAPTEAVLEGQVYRNVEMSYIDVVSTEILVRMSTAMNIGGSKSGAVGYAKEAWSTRTGTKRLPQADDGSAHIEKNKGILNNG